MISYLPLEKLDVTVDFGGSAGDCLALARLSVGPGRGAGLALAPAVFARFVVEANQGEASGRPGAWENAVGKPLAVSVLVRSGDRVLALKRREGLAVQSGLWTASVTGTVVPADAAGADPLAAAALRELQEETGLAALDGVLSFRGLALAPGKAQAVALFEFATSLPPEDLLARALSWPRFGEEHGAAEALPPERALGLPLSPVSRLAVGLLLGAPPPPGHYRLAEREREALRRLASLDPLTGLLNGRAFRARLGETLASGGRAAVVLLDVDGLKLVNDRHGHAAGDEVLRRFAVVLSSAAGRVPGALAARTGGDEFAALLPGMDLAAAEGFARAVVEDPRLATASSTTPLPCGAIQASWGAAACPDDGKSADELLAAADARLRERKARRGNLSLALSTALARFGDLLSLGEAEALFSALLPLLDRAEPGLRAHCLRVGRLCRALAEAAGLPLEQAELARLAGKFHDVGKLAVHPGVLRKEGALGAGERPLAEGHAAAGAEVLGTVAALAPVAEAVRHHHERWDGSGYPDGLKGEEIPFLARVVALADVWDAAASGRHYRRPLPREEALRRVRDGAGSLFDPRLVEIFLKLKAREMIG